MSVFKNDAELLGEMRRVTENVIEEVSKKLLKELDKNIDEYVYNTEPTKYHRTNELKKLFDHIPIKHKKDSVVGGIQEYPDRLSVNPLKFQHGSNYYNKTDVRDWVAHYVNEGTSGTLFGEGYWTEPRPFFDETKKLLTDGTVDKWIRNELKKHGLMLK